MWYDESIPKSRVAIIIIIMIVMLIIQNKEIGVVSLKYP